MKAAKTIVQLVLNIILIVSCSKNNPIRTQDKVIDNDYKLLKTRANNITLNEIIKDDPIFKNNLLNLDNIPVRIGSSNGYLTYATNTENIKLTKYKNRENIFYIAPSLGNNFHLYTNKMFSIVYLDRNNFDVLKATSGNPGIPLLSEWFFSTLKSTKDYMIIRNYAYKNENEKELWLLTDNFDNLTYSNLGPIKDKLFWIELNSKCKIKSIKYDLSSMRIKDSIDIVINRNYTNNEVEGKQYSINISTKINETFNFKREGMPIRLDIEKIKYPIIPYINIENKNITTDTKLIRSGTYENNIFQKNIDLDIFGIAPPNSQTQISTILKLYKIEINYIITTEALMNNKSIQEEGILEVLLIDKESINNPIIITKFYDLDTNEEIEEPYF